MPCASTSGLLIAQFFFFGSILNLKVNERPANLHKAFKETNNSPSVILSTQTFELRMVLHKIKQINPPLGFPNVVLVCLIKVINISLKQKSACTFADKTTQLSIKTGKITFS